MTTIPFPVPSPPPDPQPAGGASPSPQPLRRRGARVGNQNARKHGLYSRQPIPNLDEAFVRARSTVGCIDEIARLRLRIKSMAATHAPHDQFLHALEVLNRLLITHHKIMHPDGDLPV